MSLIASYCGYCRGLLRDKGEDFHTKCKEAVKDYQPKQVKSTVMVCPGCVGIYCDKKCYNIQHLFVFHPESHSAKSMDVVRLPGTEDTLSCSCCKRTINL